MVGGKASFYELDEHPYQQASVKPQFSRRLLPTHVFRSAEETK